MKTAQQIYNLLVQLYPRSYRNLFGAEMMQTFMDHYQDVEASAGKVNMQFWLALIIDEMPSIAREHAASQLTRHPFLQLTISKVVIGVMILIPLYSLLFALLVKIALAIPHPPLHGLAVLITFALLLLLPGVFSIMVSYLLASAFVSGLCKYRVSRPYRENP